MRVLSQRRMRRLTCCRGVTRFSLRIRPGATSFLIMPKGISRASAVQHLVSLSQMGGIGATAPAATPGTETPRGLSHNLYSSSSGRIAAAARAAAVRDSSPYKQPSNHWSPLGPTQDVRNFAAVGHRARPKVCRC